MLQVQVSDSFLDPQRHHNQVDSPRQWLPLRLHSVKILGCRKWRHHWVSECRQTKNKCLVFYKGPSKTRNRFNRPSQPKNQYLTKLQVKRRPPSTSRFALSFNKVSVSLAHSVPSHMIVCQLRIRHLKCLALSICKEHANSEPRAKIHMTSKYLPMKKKLCN